MDEAEEMAPLEAELEARIERLNKIETAPDGLREVANFMDWITERMGEWADVKATVSKRRADLVVRALSDVWQRLGTVAGNYMEVAVAIRIKQQQSAEPVVDRESN